MRLFHLVVIACISASLVTAGCISDPTGTLAGRSESPKTGSTIVSAPPHSATPAGSDAWIFWREEPVDIRKGGYSMNRPNLDSRYFRDLKVEVATSAPVTVRFVTLEQSDAYQKAWSDFYERQTASSFDPDSVGHVEGFRGISQGSVEAQGSEPIVIFIEPHEGVPATGTFRMYYRQ
jgi:hypothetical protein